jgi:hypothetical protein
VASELDQVGRKLGETDTVFVGKLDIFDRGWHSEEVFSSEDQYMAGTASGDGLADHANRSTLYRSRELD